MSTHDAKGKPWAKLSELKAGDRIRLDGGFTCTCEGYRHVRWDKDGLFFTCDQQRLYLASQADDGEHLVGIYPL